MLRVSLDVVDDVVQQVRSLRLHANVHGDVGVVHVKVVKLGRVVHKHPHAVILQPVRLPDYPPARLCHGPQHREVLPPQVPQRLDIPPVTQSQAVQVPRGRVPFPRRLGRRVVVRVGGPLRVRVEQKSGIFGRIVEQQPLCLLLQGQYLVHPPDGSLGDGANVRHVRTLVSLHGFPERHGSLRCVPVYMFLQKLFACVLGLVVEAPGVEHVHAQPWGEQRVESAVVITVLHPAPRRALGQGDGTGEGVGIADGYGRSRELHHRLRGAPGEGSLGNRARVPGQVWTSAEWTRGRFLIFQVVSAPAERRRRFLCHRLAPDPP